MRPIPALPQIEDLDRCARFVGLDIDLPEVARSLEASAASIRGNEIEKRASVFDADTLILESQPGARDPSAPPSDAETRIHLEMILRAAEIVPSLIQRSKDALRTALRDAATSVDPALQLDEARLERAVDWWARGALRKLLKRHCPGSFPEQLKEDLEDSQILLSPEVWADGGVGEQSLLAYERESGEELRACWRTLHEYWKARLRNDGKTRSADGVPLRTKVAASTVRLWDFEVRVATQIELGSARLTRDLRMIRTSRLLPAVAAFAIAQNRLESLADSGAPVPTRAKDVSAQVSAALREFSLIARERMVSFAESVTGGSNQAAQNERYRLRMRQVRDRLGAAVAAELLTPETRTSGSEEWTAADRAAVLEALRPMGRLREDGTWQWENMHADWPRGIVDPSQ